MSKNTLDFVKGTSFYTEQTKSQFFKDLKKLLRKLEVSYTDVCCNDTFIGTAGEDNDKQILTINSDGSISIENGNTVDLCETVKFCETLTTLSGITFENNVLTISFIGEDGVIQTQSIDLSTIVPIDVDNDLGIGIDGKVETGFPLHRYTETDQSGFQRHWQGGRFSWAYGDYSTNFNNNQIGLFRTNSAQNQRIYIDNVQTYIDATNSTRTSYIYNAPSYCSLNTRLLSTGQTASVSTNYNQILNTLQEATNLSLTHQLRVEDTRNIIHRFNNGTTPQTDSRYMSFSQIIQNGIPTQMLSTTQSTSTLLAKPTIAGNHTLIVNNTNNIPSSTTSALDVYGDAWVFGGLWNVSDISIKENLNKFPYGLNEILKLNPIEYDIKNNLETQNIYTNKKQYGFVAQEVKEVLPIAVSDFNLNYVSKQIEEEESYTDDNGELQTRVIKKDIIDSALKLGVNKDIIYITLINAIKELETRVKNLEMLK